MFSDMVETGSSAYVGLRSRAEKNPSRYRIKSKIIHPQYDRTGHVENDIALLQVNIKMEQAVLLPK